MIRNYFAWIAVALCTGALAVSQEVASKPVPPATNAVERPSLGETRLVPCPPPVTALVPLNLGMAALGTRIVTETGDSSAVSALVSSSADASFPVSKGTNILVLRLDSPRLADRLQIRNLGVSGHVTLYGTLRSANKGERDWTVLANRIALNPGGLTTVTWAIQEVRSLRIDLMADADGVIGPVEIYGVRSITSASVVPRKATATPSPLAQPNVSSLMAGARVLYSSGLSNPLMADLAIDGDMATAAVFEGPGRKALMIDLGRPRKIQKISWAASGNGKEMGVFRYPALESSLPPPANPALELPAPGPPPNPTPGGGVPAASLSTPYDWIWAFVGQASTGIEIPNSFFQTEENRVGAAPFDPKIQAGSLKVESGSIRVLLLEFTATDNAPLSVFEISTLTDPEAEPLEVIETELVEDGEIKGQTPGVFAPPGASIIIPQLPPVSN
jgi:mRNA-degrading endonuclease toxin of MazEF toxin-antitoxin module